MKILKKLVSLIVITSCTTAYADLGNGAYIGVGVDSIWTRYNFDVVNKSNGIKYSTHPNNQKYVGHAFAGYGNSINTFYWGLEVGTYYPEVSKNVTRPGVSLTSQTFENQLKLQNYFTADFTPGIKFNNCVLLYGRVGYSYAKATLKQSDIPNAPGFTNTTGLSGLRLGASLDFLLNPNWIIGVDYVYSYYQQWNFYPSSQFPNTQFKYRPTTQDLGLHLKYSFC